MLQTTSQIFSVPHMPKRSINRRMLTKWSSLSITTLTNDQQANVNHPNLVTSHNVMQPLTISTNKQQLVGTSYQPSAAPTIPVLHSPSSTSYQLTSATSFTHRAPSLHQSSPQVHHRSLPRPPPSAPPDLRGARRRPRRCGAAPTGWCPGTAAPPARPRSKASGRWI